jgi:hypothetical protein
MKDLNLLSLIKSRRSIRIFNNDKVDDEKIRLIIESGIWAPAGSNQQEIKFMIIDDESILKEFAKYKHIKSAKFVILLFIDFENYYSEYGNIKYKPHKKELPYIDTGLAMMNMMLMSESLGVNSVALNVSKFLLYDSIKKRNFMQKILARVAFKLNKSYFGLHYYYKFCHEHLNVDTTKLIPSGAIAFGYGKKTVNLDKFKHGKKPVKRDNIDHYLLNKNGKGHV